MTRPMFDLSRAMTEDELLAGIVDALGLCGWRWMHIIRSDGVTAGSSGWPDIVAVHPDRDVVLAWELKGERTPVTGDQAAWLVGLRDRRVDARLVRPIDYDAALQVIAGATRPRGLAPGEIEPRDHWPIDHEQGE